MQNRDYPIQFGLTRVMMNWKKHQSYIIGNHIVQSKKPHHCSHHKFFGHFLEQCLTITIWLENKASQSSAETMQGSKRNSPGSTENRDHISSRQICGDPDSPGHPVSPLSPTIFDSGCGPTKRSTYFSDLHRKLPSFLD